MEALTQVRWEATGMSNRRRTPATISSVFLTRPFHRLANSHGTAGAGLGLSICKRIVSLMDGEVGLSSAPGEGSTFWFTTRLGLRADPVELQAALRGRRALVIVSPLDVAW